MSEPIDFSNELTSEPDRYYVRVMVFDGDCCQEHDLGKVRIKADELMMLSMNEDGAPFVYVIPECEGTASQEHGNMGGIE